jgi:hypothetical protein
MKNPELAQLIKKFTEDVGEFYPNLKLYKIDITPFECDMYGFQIDKDKHIVTTDGQDLVTTKSTIKWQKLTE